MSIVLSYEFFLEFYTTVICFQMKIVINVLDVQELVKVGNEDQDPRKDLTNKKGQVF
jgi:hypothetical protein